MRLVNLLFLCVLFVSSCASPQVRAADILDEAHVKHLDKDWQGVIRLTTRAMEIDPGNPWSYTMRGVAYNAQGKYRLAIADQNVAIEISPDYAPAFTNKAIAFLRLGDLPIARMNMEEALVLDRTNLTVLMTAVEVYAASGDLEMACQLLIESVEAGFSELEMIEDRGVFRALVDYGCFRKARLMIGEGQDFEFR